MPRRPLGKTGLDVSVLGFGASPLGGVFQVGASVLRGKERTSQGLRRNGWADENCIRFLSIITQFGLHDRH